MRLLSVGLPPFPSNPLKITGDELNAETPSPSSPFAGGGREQVPPEEEGKPREQAKEEPRAEPGENLGGRSRGVRGAEGVKKRVL